MASIAGKDPAVYNIELVSIYHPSQQSSGEAAEKSRTTAEAVAVSNKDMVLGAHQSGSPLPAILPHHNGGTL